MAVSFCILVSQSFWKARMAAVAHHCSCVKSSKILQRVDANAEDVHVLPCPSLETRDKNTSNLNNGNSASHYFFLCFNTQSTCPGYLCTHQPSIFRWCESCVCELIHVIIQNISKYQHASPIQPHTVTHTSPTNSSQLKLLIWIAGTEAIGARIRTLATSGLFLDRGSRLWW